MKSNRFGIYNLQRWTGTFVSQLTSEARDALKRIAKTQSTFQNILPFGNLQTAIWATGGRGFILKTSRAGEDLPYLVKIFKNDDISHGFISTQVRIYRRLEELLLTNPRFQRYLPRCHFVERGFIDEEGTVHPFVLMEEVKGVTLDGEYLLSASKQEIKATGDAFIRLILDLEREQISFSDLSGDNLIVRKNDSGEICVTAVDFDEVYFPGLGHGVTRLSGKPSWNHHNRRMDNPIPLDERTGAFSALLIYLSLCILASDKEQYLNLLEENQFENDSPLLFTVEDLESPQTSPLFWSILRHDDRLIQYLAERFKEYAADNDPTRTPLLHDILRGYYMQNGSAIVRAANHRDSKAMAELSLMFEYGFWCPQNNNAAEYWRRKSSSSISSLKK